MQNKIAFLNLRAEMSRKNLTLQAVSAKSGIKVKTLSEKLAMKRPINLSEAFTINRLFFPECDLTYLFEELYQDRTLPNKTA